MIENEDLGHDVEYKVGIFGTPKGEIGILLPGKKTQKIMAVDDGEVTVKKNFREGKGINCAFPTPSSPSSSSSSSSSSHSLCAF